MIYLQLFLSYLKIGFFGFGGGYAMLSLIQHEVVISHQWISNSELTDIIAISQMTPGPLAVNGSTFVGLRVAGIFGAVVATFGCVISGVLISLALQSFFAKNKSETVELTLKALKSVSIGLIASAASVIVLLSWFAVSSWRQISGGPDLRAVGISLAALLLLRKFHMNPVWVMCVCGAAGFFLY